MAALPALPADTAPSCVVRMRPSSGSRGTPVALVYGSMHGMGAEALPAAPPAAEAREGTGGNDGLRRRLGADSSSISTAADTPARLEQGGEGGLPTRSSSAVGRGQVHGQWASLARRNAAATLFGTGHATGVSVAAAAAQNALQCAVRCSQLAAAASSQLDMDQVPRSSVARQELVKPLLQVKSSDGHAIHDGCAVNVG